MSGPCPICCQRLHTTPMGEIRIRRNMGLRADVDTVQWCRTLIQNINPEQIIHRGKNYYVDTAQVSITINASTFTIITAHRKKILTYKIFVL